MEIRPYRSDDLNALYFIALATGLAGGDASSHYKDPNLIGHIYMAPYVSLKPQLAFVAEDDQGVAGYIVGVDDSASWEDQLERDWWPSLRNTYADPQHDQHGQHDHWTPDDRRIRSIYHPHRTPHHVNQQYPAHVHLNLLPRLQGQGVGSRLIRHWLSQAKTRGVEAVHVGVNRKNIGGLRFWSRQGYKEIEPHDPHSGTVWMGTHTAHH